MDRKQTLESEYFKRNDLKKALKLSRRVSKFIRKRDEPNAFVEEDIDTLEFRQTADLVDELHIKNYQNQAVILRRQNCLTDSLQAINTCLNKLDHKNYDSLCIKISILVVQNDYKSVRSVLSDLRVFHPDKNDAIDSLKTMILFKIMMEEKETRDMYRKMLG